MTILGWAEHYYDRGWCTVPMKGKKAACKWRQYQNQRPDLVRVQQWFSNGQYKGIGVVLGEVSGYLACRDFDDPEAYKRWTENHPELATELPTVKTGRGLHVYFTCKGAKTRKLDDGELRGEKSLCILPPSEHFNGKKYEWIVPLRKNHIPAIDPEKAGLTAETPLRRKEAVLQKRTEAIRSKPKQSEAIGSNTKAITLVGDDEIEMAITFTLPKAFGKRNHQVFQLARALQGISAFADADPNTLLSVVQKWHSRALPHISTKPFEETWIDFLYGWPRVNTPMRLNLLADAMKTAIENPVPDLKYEQPGLRNLVGLCRELQTIMGDQPFWLSTGTAGRLLGVDRMTAWRWLFLLEQDGWIKTETKGNTHRATRYRYLGRQKGPSKKREMRPGEESYKDE